MTDTSPLKQIRCCIYARVSTDEQAERDLSIPFQLERCRYHAQGNQWEVVKEFVDAGESARTDKRPEFQEMITAARNREFDVILVHKLDRFARNDYDFVIYEKELDELGISLESVSEPGDASTPAGYISRRMMQVISSWYSKNLAVEVKKGMLKKVENGGWPKLAPLGYLNKHDDQKSWIDVDPKLGPIIARAFKEFAEEKWTLDDWTQHVYSSGYRTRTGKKIYKSAWGAIFHNRFYLGETWLRAGDVPVKGNHTPLVDEVTFSKVQEVLGNHDKHRQHVRRHKYLLQGLAYSLEADSPCWAETNPKKKISYYRSRSKVNGTQIYYNAKTIEQQLIDIIREITISEDSRQEWRNQVQDWFNDEDKSNADKHQAEERLVKLRKMEQNLQQLMLEDEISLADYKAHRKKIEAERSREQFVIDSIGQRQHLIMADFEVALKLATELSTLFVNASFEEKRLLCEIVFKRIYLKEGMIADYELNSPFRLINLKKKSSGTVQTGWGRRIRTFTDRSRVCCPTIRLFPSTFLIITKILPCIKISS